MGKVWSKREVRVSTSAQTYSPGDQVNGQISVFLPTDSPRLTLVLSVLGIESYSLPPHRETRNLTILSFSAPIFNDALHAGQYMFPFGFVLPPGVPSSFRHKTPSFDASVVYTVKVEAEKGGAMHEAEFGVVNAVRNLQPLQVEQSYKVKTFCVLSSQLRVRGFLERQEYWPGDRLTVSIAIDTSESGRGVRQITIDLLRVTKLRTKTGLRTFPHLVKGFVKGVAVGAHTPQQELVEAGFALSELNIGGNSTKGKMVESEFAVNLTMRTYDELCTEGEEYTLVLPVTIHGAAVPVDYTAAFPLEWRPAVMSQTHLSLPAQFAPSAPPEDL